ncbi:hypothetical protein GHT06_009749 [Daphnia sinensis]|uniref:Gustatory receptor n=1 Tax=Daphnia sinensis TaxID=1820382 RepID=A0AAD5PZJ5_9CRUS|nr:hypothetical protein GHT06_009749 [Daphnia sinensis]
MSVFEQLRPFVRLCQVCGLIPYTMKRNSITGKFEQFTFSVRNVSTWWFLLVFISQISAVVVVRFLSSYLQGALSTEGNIPTTMIFLTGVTSSAFLAQLLSSRWIALNYRHLDNVVKAVQEIERLFGESFLLKHKSSIMIRFIAGFAIAMTMAIGALFVMGPMFSMLLPENTSVFAITALFMILVSVNVMFDSSLLFIHICYYIIAHYIQLISLCFKNEDNGECQQAVREGTNKIKLMRRNALIFDYLCRASSELNSIFSLPAFFLLGLKFVTVISCAFAYTYRFIHKSVILENSNHVHSFLFLMESVRFCCLLAAADMPVHQVRVLHGCISNMSLSGFSKTLTEKIAMMTLLVQIDEDRVHLSAVGLFKIGVHLIPAVTNRCRCHLYGHPPPKLVVYDEEFTKPFHCMQTAAIMLSNVGLFPAKMKHDGMIFAVLVLINRSFMVMMLMSSFLLVYFCYYIVACYIRLVALDMKRPFQLSPVEKITGAKAKTIAWMQVNDTKTVLSWKYKWKQSKRMFGDLCKALSELNEVFSLPSLVFLTLRLISSAFSLYVTIYGSLRTNNAFIQALAPACAVNFTTGFLSILVVLKGIETPIIEFKHLRQRIFSVLNEEPDIQMDDEFEALSFLQHITEGRARLSAAGLFYVGLNLLPSVRFFNGVNHYVLNHPASDKAGLVPLVTHEKIRKPCGMIPYAIEHDPITGKFERFTFSFRSFFTWWFLLVLAYQICGLTMMGYLSSDIQEILSTDKTIPTTLNILSSISSSLFLAQLLPPRWVALHYRRLTNAVEAIQNVERLLGEEFITEHESSIPIRFVLGFFAAVMASTGALVVTMPMYSLLIPPSLGIFPAVAFFVVSASISIMFDCFLLFVHLCYYIIAHYIQLVSLRYCNKQENDEFPERIDKIQMMKRNALALDYLFRASSELNSVFSVPVFIILTIKFVGTVSACFACAYRFIHTNVVLDNASLIYPFLIVTESIRILVLLTAADMPLNQVRRLHERITAMSLSGFSETIAEKTTMMTLLAQMDEDRVHLSAAGLFKVGVHLIPALSGAIVTYMVILLQN